MSVDTESPAEVSARRRGVTLEVVHAAAASTWTGDRLRQLIERPLSNPALDKIEARRKALADMPKLVLHASYAGVNSNAGQPFVSVKTISLPRRYGRMLYSIAVETKPRLTLEAGAGLGVSGMYLGAAAALLRTGRLVSFEIGDYHDVAQDSIRTTLARSDVHQDDFNNLNRYLDATDTVDLCFLDAKHDKDTVLRNYKSVLGWMSAGCVLMIDDVMSTPSSRSAWGILSSRGDFTFAACIQNRIGFLAR